MLRTIPIRSVDLFITRWNAGVGVILFYDNSDDNEGKDCHGGDDDDNTGDDNDSGGDGDGDSDDNDDYNGGWQWWW